MTALIETLVVDDQDDVRLLVRAYLEAENDGLHVAGDAADGPTCVDLADRLDPTVIVLDESMPGMSGLETARRVLARRPAQAIVLFTAHLSPDLAARAAAAGIDRCLAKDDIAELAGAIREVAERRSP